MTQFYYDQVSLLVTTPLATRGLDFPNVTHVLNLGIVGTAADYLHRAGRCGRIGQNIAQPGKWNIAQPGHNHKRTFAVYMKYIGLFLVYIGLFCRRYGIHRALLQNM